MEKFLRILLNAALRAAGCQVDYHEEHEGPISMVPNGPDSENDSFILCYYEDEEEHESYGSD